MVTLADVRKITRLLDEGNSDLAHVLGLVNMLADAANYLGFNMSQFNAVIEGLHKTREPFHALEQMMQPFIEASPFRFRNKSDGDVVLPDSTVLKRGNIISLDEDERNSAAYCKLIDEDKVLQPLKYLKPPFEEAEDKNFAPGW